MVLTDLISRQEVGLGHCVGGAVVDILDTGMNMAILCGHRTISIQDLQVEYEETSPSHQCGLSTRMRP